VTIATLPSSCPMLSFPRYRFVVATPLIGVRIRP
jgi:hypothetical protein